jgi:hypothetical protein
MWRDLLTDEINYTHTPPASLANPFPPIPRGPPRPCPVPAPLARSPPRSPGGVPRRTRRNPDAKQEASTGGGVVGRFPGVSMRSSTYPCRHRASLRKKRVTKSRYRHSDSGLVCGEDLSTPQLIPKHLTSSDGPNCERSARFPKGLARRQTSSLSTAYLCTNLPCRPD